MPAIDSITDEAWRAPVAKYFKSEIIVGRDLMVVWGATALPPTFVDALSSSHAAAALSP
jgi:hypothetical protein